MRHGAPVLREPVESFLEELGGIVSLRSDIKIIFGLLWIFSMYGKCVDICSLIS